MTNELLLLVFLPLSCWLVVAIHEVGHALTARLLGRGVWVLRIGGRPWLWDRQGPSGWIRLGANPLAGGRTIVVGGGNSWAGDLLFVGSGNVLVIGVGAVLVFLLADVEHWPAERTWLAIWCYALLGWIVFLLMGEVVPKHPNDMSQLLGLLRMAGRRAPSTSRDGSAPAGLDQAWAELRRGNAAAAAEGIAAAEQWASTDSLELLWVRFGLARQRWDHDAMVQLGDRLRQAVKPMPFREELMLLVDDARAHGLLLRGWPRDVERAERITRFTCRQGRSPSVIATRAVARLPGGEVAAAESALREVRGRLGKGERAICDCWLAVASAARGEVAEAYERLQQLATDHPALADVAAARREVERLSA